MAGTRAQSTDAVAHVDAVDAAYALHGSVPDREDHSLSTLERHDLRSRLLARALLGEDELATGEIVVGPREQEGGLQRENMLAIDVLVQAVIVARAVLQQQGRRLALARRVAARQVDRMLGGIAHGNPHRLVPAIG